MPADKFAQNVLSQTSARDSIHKETRVLDTRLVSPSTRWIARHISADIFFRQRKEISDDLAEPSPLYRAAYLPTYSSLSPPSLPCRRSLLFFFSTGSPSSPSQYLFLFNFLCREKMACRSRLSIQMGLAYRDRARITLCFRDVRLRFP